MTTAMVKQELAVASFSTVYDLEQVETALSDLNESASDALRATYERMLKTGNLRFCVKPNRMPSFDALGEALPISPSRSKTCASRSRCASKRRTGSN